MKERGLASAIFTSAGRGHKVTWRCSVLQLTPDFSFRLLVLLTFNLMIIMDRHHLFMWSNLTITIVWRDANLRYVLQKPVASVISQSFWHLEHQCHRHICHQKSQLMEGSRAWRGMARQGTTEFQINLITSPQSDQWQITSQLYHLPIRGHELAGTGLKLELIVDIPRRCHMSHSLSLLISASKCTFAGDHNHWVLFLSLLYFTAWWPCGGWWCWCRRWGRSRPGRMLMLLHQHEGFVTQYYTCHMSHVNSYMSGVWFGIEWLL